MGYSRIMFAGPSGFGKTTLANWVSDMTGIPFESGSVSDLIPDTKELSHQYMLSRDADILYKEDFQILNLRNKLFASKETFVSDRSYLDSAAYFLYKQSSLQPACEVDHFLNVCSMLLAKQCDCLIFLDFIPEVAKGWITEDNGKRIVSNYFQVLISSLMNTSLKFMGYEKTNTYDSFTLKEVQNLLKRLTGNILTLNYAVEEGVINTFYGRVPVYIIREPNLELRKSILKEVLCLKN